MKRKILLVLLSLILVTGCGSKKESKKDKVKDNKPTETIVEEPKEPEYVDDNTIIVSLYDRNGNTLKLQKEYNKTTSTDDKSYKPVATFSLVDSKL